MTIGFAENSIAESARCPSRTISNCASQDVPLGGLGIEFDYGIPHDGGCQEWRKPLRKLVDAHAGAFGIGHDRRVAEIGVRIQRRQQAMDVDAKLQAVDFLEGIVSHKPQHPLGPCVAPAEWGAAHCSHA
jgi:hypothetical protein